MTPAGIEPATFRFVAQHLNHCATAVPDGQRYCPKHVESYSKNKFEKLVLLVGCIIKMAQWLLWTKYFKNTKGYQY